MKYRNNSNKYILRRFLCVFLLLLTVFSLSAPAFADYPEHPFDYYVALGDSIGYHVQAGRDYIPNDQGFLISTYPQLVQDYYEADGFYGNRCGWRATEALAALIPDYMGDDYTENFLFYWGGMDISGIKSRSPAYIEGIKKADLITLNFGSNDLLGTTTYVTRKVMVEKTAGTCLERATLDAIEEAMQNDSLPAVLESLLEFTYDTLNGLVEKETLIQDLTAALANFPVSWNRLIREIRKLNSTATIVAVSIYTPVGYSSVEDLLSHGMVEMLNNEMAAGARLSGEYSFLDIGLPDLTGSRDGSHLGDVGHREVADKIIATANKTLPCDHAHCTLINKKEATRLSSGYSGDLRCDTCGEIIHHGAVTVYSLTGQVKSSLLLTGLKFAATHSLLYSILNAISHIFK